MIFVCCGSRGYQFDRLVKELDELCEKGIINGQDVFAQIASCNYLPTFYKYQDFITKEDYEKYQDEADIIISHAGVGSLIGALKKGKQVISVPRYYRFKEHIDDHQLQISSVLASEGYLREVLDIKDLGKTIQLCKKEPIIKRYENKPIIVDIIDDYISKL